MGEIIKCFVFNLKSSSWWGQFGKQGGMVSNSALEETSGKTSSEKLTKPRPQEKK